MKGRICEADVVHVESFLSFLPAGPLLRPPTVPHRKVKPGHYSMHLSKLLNKHKTIETRALDVNSSLLEMDANKPNDDYKNGYKTQISTQVGNMDVVKKVKQQLLGD